MRQWINIISESYTPEWFEQASPVPDIYDVSEDARDVLTPEELDWEWRLAEVPVEYINFDSVWGGETEEEGEKKFNSIRFASKLPPSIYQLLPNGRCKILDGWHRFYVARELGLRHITAYVGRY